MHDEYKDAFLEIISRYNKVYKEDMSYKDLQSVEGLISTGLGFWETDENSEEYYSLPCILEKV